MAAASRQHPRRRRRRRAPAESSRPHGDLKLGRRFTREGVHPYDAVEWETRTARIGSADAPIFEQENVEVPAFWSQNATNIVAQKYFAYGQDDPRRETSVKQMIDRVVDKITAEGEKEGYFADGEAEIFADELRHILVHQMASFNSPVWFNIGLEGAPQTASACFILSIDDTLESIANWYTEEIQVFRRGSGAGLNISRLRGSMEELSHGGRSSGPVSFMRAADASAGTIQSGGRTRRAAKMVILDVDHPDIEEFVWCKAREEERIRALAAAGFDMSMGSPAGERNLAEATAYQNANNSVRLTDEFMRAVEEGKQFDLLARTTGEVVKSVDARELFKQIAEAAWRCADPGIQYDTTIQDWHTTPAQGRITGSNPCCFAGETLVDTSEGKIRFDELHRMHEQGEKLPYAFSWDCDRRLPALRRIRKVWVAGHTKRLVEVRTDKGIVVRCTPEHRFLTHDGTWVEAQDLAEGMRLRKIARWMNEHRSGRHYINHRITDEVGNGTIDQASFMWSEVFGRIPEGMEVHHINGDPTDDRLSNFELRDRGEHRREHSAGSSNPRFIDPDMDLLVRVWEEIESTPRQWPGDLVTPARWNAYIERNGVKGLVPQACGDDRIMGMEWSEFTAMVEENRTLVNDRVVSVETVELDEAVPVYDLEVEGVHNFGVSSGDAVHSVIAHNSEYMSNDNSSCNLASLNLLAFLDDEGNFDVDAFRHVARIVFLAQEITISFADLPTRKIERNTRNLRQIGIGYSNLGALLMNLGLAYDSDAGREVAAAVTALLTGEAYAQSTRIAERVGSFAYYTQNAEPMQRVLRKHRQEAKRLPSEGIAGDIARAARGSWNEAVRRCAEHGIRNAQASVLAPTGTISFMMDCDTFGIEPDFSLVKSKILAGGGTMQIVNHSVPRALRRLGYSESEIADIAAYIEEHGNVVSAPHLKPEHYPVFDCAVGERPIQPLGHVRMMAAVQPFLSGAISKTVNVPESATVEDIADLYMQGWKMGLKALAIYRDASKANQPLASSKSKSDEASEAEEKDAEERLHSLLGDGLRRGERRRVPREAEVVGTHFTIGGVSGYVHVRLFEDGTPGGLFVDVGQAGSTLHGFIRTWSVTMGVALQHGVPLDILVSKLAFTQFEPAGITNDPQIRTARSIVDYIVRWMAARFLDPEVHAQLGIRQPEPVPGEKADGDKTIPGGDIAPRADVHSPTRPAQGQNQGKLKLTAQTGAGVCLNCRSGTLQRAGTCFVCDACGETSGCS